MYCGKDLFNAVQAWVGHWPGGLAVATIISCGIFAAISGVSVATAATIGVVAIPEMIKRSIYLGDIESLDEEGKKKIKKYFKKTIFPMLTPMVFDNLHSFPILMNKVLIYGVVTKSSDNTNKRKISFIQIPVNIPRFFERIK